MTTAASASSIGTRAREAGRNRSSTPTTMASRITQTASTPNAAASTGTINDPPPRPEAICHDPSAPSRFSDGVSQKLRQLSHVVEDNRSRPPQVLGGGQSSGKGEGEHA